MLELTGFAAITGVLTGSVLISLFLGEAVIGWVISAMDAGVKRADEAAERLAGKPTKLRNGLQENHRVRGCSPDSVCAFTELEVLPG